jgi:ATP-dependent RNA circularization protein (DNA/RNA ligase family)
MARVMRLNETGLRRLVRGMLREMSDDGGYRAAMRRADEFGNALQKDLDTTMGMWDEDEMFAKQREIKAKHAEILRDEVEALLPKMANQAAQLVDIKPSRTSQDLEIHLRYKDSRGKTEDFRGNYEDLVYFIWGTNAG